MNKPLQTVEPAGIANQALVTLDPKSYVAEVYAPFNARLQEAIANAESVRYDIQTKEGMAVAREHRAILRAIRIDADKERAAQKAPFTTANKLLESGYTEIESAVSPYENKFHADIKAEEERIEAEKAAKLKAEEDAKAAIQAKIDAIKNRPLEVMNKSAAEIEEAIAELSPLIPTPAEFGERFIEAEFALKVTIDTLNSILSGKKAQEQLEAQNRALQAEQEAREAEAQLAAKEQARIDGIKAKIQAIKNNIIAASECDFSSQISELMTSVDDMLITESEYQEFTAEAREIVVKTFNALKRQRDSLLQAEQEEAEAAAEVKAKAEANAADAKQAAAEQIASADKPIPDGDAIKNDTFNEADFNNVFGVKDQEASAANVTSINVQRPSLDDLVNCVANAYKVDGTVAYEWLAVTFADQAKAA